MPTIDAENRKSIREPMIVKVTVGDPSNPIFAFDNSNIISCELNLRSDLSPIDPILPESEIIVRVYWREDISDELITIDSDTVITYTSGYEQQMSPVRTFYLSERITWQDRVLTIRGVDAVHFLDEEEAPVAVNYMVSNFSGGNIQNTKYRDDNGSSVYSLFSVFKSYITSAGISFTNTPTNPPALTSGIGDGNNKSVIERKSRREVVANLMNLMRIDVGEAYIKDQPKLRFTYVDAGRPWCDSVEASVKWTIYEADCGEIKKHLDDKINKIQATVKTIELVPFRPAFGTQTGDGNKAIGIQIVGSADIIKDIGASLTFNTLSSVDVYYASRENPPSGSSQMQYHYANYVALGATATAKPKSLDTYAIILRDGKSGTGFQGWNDYPTDRQTANVNCQSVSGYWTRLGPDYYRYIQDTGATTFHVDLVGDGFNLTSKTVTYNGSGSGVTAKPSKTTWVGESYLENIAGTATKTLLPDEGFKALMNRSNETGSFRWKGDPRMQPRDVFKYVYMDGREEVRTIESINLKHERGGLVATITYRKGNV